MARKRESLYSILRENKDIKQNERSVISAVRGLLTNDIEERDSWYSWAALHKNHTADELKDIEADQWLLHREGEFNGQTAFHILICRGDTVCLENILKKDNLWENCGKLLKKCANGSNFDKTVMMGQLPFSIAALTFNKRLVKTFLIFGRTMDKRKEKGTSEVVKELNFNQEMDSSDEPQSCGEPSSSKEVDASKNLNSNKEEQSTISDKLDLLLGRNTLGDTVLHSLIRYAHVYPHLAEKVKDMMQYLHGLFLIVYKDVSPRKVWLMKNHDGRTPLQLAAELSQPELFHFILSLEDVYSELSAHDGLTDYLAYDITEIDPAAARYAKKKMGDRSLSCSLTTNCISSCQNLFSPKYKVGDSVLEIVCGCPPVQATFSFLKNPVVKQIIQKKWEKYQRWVWICGLFHFMFMLLVTVYTVLKCQVALLKNNASVFDDSIIDGTMILGQTQEYAVLTLTIVFFLFSLLLLSWEIFRIKQGHWYHIDLAHHNGLYRVLLVLLAIGLLGDAVWFWCAPGSYGNYFIILALIMGWWFMTFFFRPFKTVSFFTIMLQEVLSGDLLRFSSVIMFVYLSFTTAMYAVFLPKPPKEFDGYDKTMLTMFEMMLGQTDVEVLHEATEPWLAVLLFALFIVLTYILMLNALIALMSNTFNAVFNAREELKNIQRLAVLLFIEASFPCQRLVHIVGVPRMWLTGSDEEREERYTEQVPSAARFDTESDLHGSEEASDKRVTKLKANLLDSLKFHSVLCETDEESPLKTTPSETCISIHSNPESKSTSRADTSSVAAPSSDDSLTELTENQPHSQTKLTLVAEASQPTSSKEELSGITTASTSGSGKQGVLKRHPRVHPVQADEVPGTSSQDAVTIYNQAPQRGSSGKHGSTTKRTKKHMTL